MLSVSAGGARRLTSLRLASVAKLRHWLAFDVVSAETPHRDTAAHGGLLPSVRHLHTRRPAWHILHRPDIVLDAATHGGLLRGIAKTPQLTAPASVHFSQVITMLIHSRLAAAFYLVSAKTPPYRTPVLAHPSEVSINMPPLVAAFSVVSDETCHTWRPPWHTFHRYKHRHSWRPYTWCPLRHHHSWCRLGTIFTGCCGASVARGGLLCGVR
ncbi:hypothetical protein BRADI_1g22525v3 [Brachypodium distachyon]|uniref:Uncharacterized protein n=1 Tax=Brachypodium distachyon TaxID=15368 RepID=A0A0Q3GWK6_BRADI|nr:hypothetical protein BRADI_1g22525v3 [Brachypodium distachyon]